MKEKLKNYFDIFLNKLIIHFLVLNKLIIARKRREKRKRIKIKERERKKKKEKEEPLNLKFQIFQQKEHEKKVLKLFLKEQEITTKYLSKKRKKERERERKRERKRKETFKNSSS